METRLTVVTITLAPSIDYSMQISSLVPEEKLRASLDAVEPGGGGIQVARGLRKLQGHVEAVVALGGATGATLLRLLIDEGVNVHPIQVIPNTRPSITLHVRDQNVNYRIVGASEPLGERDLAPVVGRLREIDPLPPYVILSGSFPPGVPVDLIAKTQAFCAERGVEFIVDTSGAPLLAAVEAGVMLVKPSKEELAAAVGAEPDDPTFDVPVAARSLVDRGVHNVVVSLGPDGCFVTTREGDEAYLTPPPATVVSTVGAGDSLLAGTVSGLSRGLPMIDAVRLGVAAGTATCTYPGSQLFTAGDIARLAPLVKVKRSRRG